MCTIRALRRRLRGSVKKPGLGTIWSALKPTRTRSRLIRGRARCIGGSVGQIPKTALAECWQISGRSKLPCDVPDVKFRPLHIIGADWGQPHRTPWQRRASAFSDQVAESQSTGKPTYRPQPAASNKAKNAKNLSGESEFAIRPVADDPPGGASSTFLNSSPKGANCSLTTFSSPTATTVIRDREVLPARLLYVLERRAFDFVALLAEFFGREVADPQARQHASRRFPRLNWFADPYWRGPRPTPSSKRRSSATNGLPRRPTKKAPQREPQRRGEDEAPFKASEPERASPMRGLVAPYPALWPGA